MEDGTTGGGHGWSKFVLPDCVSQVSASGALPVITDRECTELGTRFRFQTFGDASSIPSNLFVPLGVSASLLEPALLKHIHTSISGRLCCRV